MDKHSMCLQLHVSVDSGGPEVLLYDGPGLSRGAKSDIFTMPEDISVHILRMTSPAICQQNPYIYMHSYITELDTEN